MVGDRPSEGGGVCERGWHRNDFFSITFIVHNQKSNGGGGEAWCEWRSHGPPRQHPHGYSTV